MKDYKAVAAVLKVDSLPSSASGAFSLTESQMQAIEDRLAELEKSVEKANESAAEKDAAIADLTAQVKDLRDAPGADTTEIEDGGGDKTCTASDMFNSIKDIL